MQDIFIKQRGLKIENLSKITTPELILYVGLALHSTNRSKYKNWFEMNAIYK